MLLADNGGCAEELAVGKRNPSGPEKTRDGRPLRFGNSPSIMPGPEDTFASYGIGWANASNTPFRRYKHWVHEGGISAPFIASWPAVIKQTNTIHRQRAHMIDLMPTVLEAAGGLRLPPPPS